MEQLRIPASLVHVVSGNPSKSLQLGPVQVNCNENPWLGPQDVRVPLAVVMLADVEQDAAKKTNSMSRGRRIQHCEGRGLMPAGHLMSGSDHSSRVAGLGLMQ